MLTSVTVCCFSRSDSCVVASFCGFSREFFFLIEVWLICNVGLVSDAQKSDSVINITSQILFHYRLLQYIEYSSLSLWFLICNLQLKVYWPSFHVHICHLYILFSEISLHVFCSCSHWIVSFLCCWVLRVLSVFLPGFCGGPDGKESACNVGHPCLIPGLGWSPGEGHGYPLQYSYLQNSMDRGAWQATVHGVSKSRTWLSDWHFHFYFMYSRYQSFVGYVIYKYSYPWTTQLWTVQVHLYVNFLFSFYFLEQANPEGVGFFFFIFKTFFFKVNVYQVLLDPSLVDSIDVEQRSRI